MKRKVLYKISALTMAITLLSGIILGQLKAASEYREAAANTLSRAIR